MIVIGLIRALYEWGGAVKNWLVTTPPTGTWTGASAPTGSFSNAAAPTGSFSNAAAPTLPFAWQHLGPIATDVGQGDWTPAIAATSGNVPVKAKPCSEVLLDEFPGSYQFQCHEPQDCTAFTGVGSAATTGQTGWSHFSIYTRPSDGIIIGSAIQYAGLGYNGMWYIKSPWGIGDITKWTTTYVGRDIMADPTTGDLLQLTQDTASTYTDSIRCHRHVVSGSYWDFNESNEVLLFDYTRDVLPYKTSHLGGFSTDFPSMHTANLGRAFVVMPWGTMWLIWPLQRSYPRWNRWSPILYATSPDWAQTFSTTQHFWFDNSLLDNDDGYTTWQLQGGGRTCAIYDKIVMLTVFQDYTRGVCEPRFVLIDPRTNQLDQTCTARPMPLWNQDRNSGLTPKGSISGVQAHWCSAGTFIASIPDSYTFAFACYYQTTFDGFYTYWRLHLSEWEYDPATNSFNHLRTLTPVADPAGGFTPDTLGDWAWESEMTTGLINHPILTYMPNRDAWLILWKSNPNRVPADGTNGAWYWYVYDRTTDTWARKKSHGVDPFSQTYNQMEYCNGCETAVARTSGSGGSSTIVRSTLPDPYTG